jgi:predicted alpha/beta hydrolase
VTARAATARRARPKRAVPAPAWFEELEIRTEDGVALRAVLVDPPHDIALLGTCVLAHATPSDKSSFGEKARPGLAGALASRGYRVIAFDFRGHGDSGLSPSGGGRTYDDLVRLDLPAVLACARARGEGKPVLIVGHGLGGHAALAAQGTGRIAADGILAIAANVWLKVLEPSRLRWAAKSLVCRAALPLAPLTARAPRVPRVVRLAARALGLERSDARGTYRALFRGALTGAWQSADGQDDYLASLARIDVPVCAVTSDGDRIQCHPASGEAFARGCGGPVEIVRVRRGDDGGPPPGHLDIVTTDRAREPLARAMEWLAQTASARAGRPTPVRRRESRRR